MLILRGGWAATYEISPLYTATKNYSCEQYKRTPHLSLLQLVLFYRISKLMTVTSRLRLSSEHLMQPLLTKIDRHAHVIFDYGVPEDDRVRLPATQDN